MYIGYVETPIGILRLKSDDLGLTQVDFCEEKQEEQVNEIIIQGKQELGEYFQGNRYHFDVPLHLVTGTSFQRSCWEALLAIPYAETRSYYEQACNVGNAKAVRAVGGANHHNPISIIIPCHRVIAKNGTLCGYGGGLERKEYLLKLEKKHHNG